MRRADRLFRIVQFLRAGRMQTARSLAQKLQVSERTIYRDVQDLQLSGVPILGEAGVGYTLRRDYDLPPLMFDQREITALVLGSRMVAAWGDTELAAAANDALRKIEAVLTPAMRDKIDSVPLYVPTYPDHTRDALRSTLEQLRGAIEGVRKIEVSYRDEKSQASSRTLRPMALLFWGNVWTLVAWCELRVDFRSFRADRFAAIQILDETFAQERGQRYEDFLAKVRSQLSRENAPAVSLDRPSKNS
jgi:predicted DNA-binding transcriptional regulator YafY